MSSSYRHSNLNGIDRLVFNFLLESLLVMLMLYLMLFEKIINQLLTTSLSGRCLGLIKMQVNVKFKRPSTSTSLLNTFVLLFDLCISLVLIV